MTSDIAIKYDVSKTRFLRQAPLSENVEMTGRWGKLHSEQVHGLSLSPNKIKYDQIKENAISLEVE